MNRFLSYRNSLGGSKLQSNRRVRQATFFFSGYDGYAELEIIINSDQSWYIVLDGKKRDNAKILGEWADIPGVVTLVSELQLLMSTVENCRTCRGCPYENFKDVVPVNENEPVFHTKSNDGAAYIEYRHSHFHENIIRSMSFSPWK